ncbi:MAG: hypothetical protein ACREPU_08040 [Rhodanobacteraceae bacterium]
MKTQHKHLHALTAGILAATVSAAGIAAAAPAHAVYVAHLQPLNTAITHTSTTGEARFVVNGNKLTVTIDVHGAPPDMVHWQHFHGFKDGQAATCPSMAEDANHDGIIDLIETGKTSGTTMVPFITHPASMDIAHGTYPEADATGNYHYQETVSLKALDAAFAKEFPGQRLDLAKRVVFIHGVLTRTRLPPTVASLGPIPAQVTLPIACGRIERARSTAH